MRRIGFRIRIPRLLGNNLACVVFWRSVLAAALAGAAATAAAFVRVAMLQFFRARRTRRDDLDFKGQIDARERMIRVEHHVITFDPSHCDDRRVTIFTGLKTVADLELAVDGQHLALYALHLLLVAQPVRFGGGDLHARFRPSGLPAQLFIEPFDDLARTFEIADRSATRRGVEQLALLIAERIVKRDNVA